MPAWRPTTLSCLLTSVDWASVVTIKAAVKRAPPPPCAGSSSLCPRENPAHVPGVVILNFRCSHHRGAACFQGDCSPPGEPGLPLRPVCVRWDQKGCAIHPVARGSPGSQPRSPCPSSLAGLGNEWRSCIAQPGRLLRMVSTPSEGTVGRGQCRGKGQGWLGCCDGCR